MALFYPVYMPIAFILQLYYLLESCTANYIWGIQIDAGIWGLIKIIVLTILYGVYCIIYCSAMVILIAIGSILSILGVYWGLIIFHNTKLRRNRLPDPEK